MATISDLNVRLGLIYKDFDKSLTAVEKKLERSGRKFSQLGNDLALSVSLPLAALGASAIKQAGEIESLNLAMVSTFAGAGRSAQDATKEVEALRQAAMAPGLDFEQAVKGSIRLQGVGLAAEEARGILTNMANAIASTGGTAEDLDGVTKQFAQMISKGRVLQEDVSIISERMPVVARLMQQAFGTSSVEAIRASGVSAKDFVARINEAAAALPKVEGGIKNALVNAAAEARNSLATLGETIVKAFDVTGKLDMFTKALQGAVSWFQSLSDEAKNTIIQIGVFAVAIGPAVKVLGALYGGAAQVVGIFGALARSTKGLALFFGGMTESTLSVTKYLKSFGEAMYGVGGAAIKMRVAVIAATGGLAAIVLGIAAAVYILSDRFDAAEFSAKAFADAQKEVTIEAKGEIGALNKNIDALKDVRTSTEDRKKAADALLAAYPQYLSGIDLEKASLGQLNKIQKDLNLSILQGVAERKKAQAVNAVYEKQAEILLRIQEIQRTKDITTDEASLINTTDLLRAGSSAEAVIQRLKQQVDVLGKQADITAKDFDKAFGLQSRAIDPLLEKEYRARAAAEDARDAFLGFDKAVTKSTEAGAKAATGADDKAKKMAAAFKAVEASIDAVNKKQAVLGSDFVGEKTTEIENGVEKLIESGFAPDSDPIKKLHGYLKAIQEDVAKGFGSQNKVQIEAGLSSAAPAALPTLAAPDQIASLNTGPAAAAVEALRSLQSAAIADIEAQKNAASSQDIARAERERVANSTSTQSIKAQIEDLKNVRLTSISEIERAQIDAQIAELERIAQEKAARQELQASVLSSAMDLATGIVGLKQAQGEAEKAQLDEEYAGKIEAAKGNADAQAKIQAELAAKKKAIDKKVGKEAQGVAIAGAVINTALGVSKALSSSPPPYNFILAALTAAAGAVQIATIKSQKFAAGGVITKPTYGLMGEYPGASRNPEIVTPERLMRSVFRDEMGAGGGQVQVYGTIRGSDIILSSERAAAERNRTR